MKKLICVALALILALSIAALSEEKAITTVVYAKVTASGSATLYQLPGTYRPVVTTLSNGTQLFVEFEGSSWHKVRTVSGGQTGWIQASDITITTRGLSALNYGSTITAVKSVRSSDGFAALRWGPGLEYDVMDNLPAGTVCRQFDVSGDWTRVLLNDGRIGYVYSTLLQNTSSQTFPAGLYGFVQVTGNSAIYRQSASYSSKALGTMPSGETVEILGESSYFWYFYSRTRNVYGYISKDILSPEGINKVAIDCTLYYDNPYVYYTDVMWNLPAGKTVKVLATDLYISRVQYDNVIGYIVNENLTIHH